MAGGVELGGARLNPHGTGGKAAEMKREKKKVCKMGVGLTDSAIIWCTPHKLIYNPLFLFSVCVVMFNILTGCGTTHKSLNRSH